MAYDIFILYQGNIYSKIEGVTAETAEDVPFYDGNNYRDIYTVPGVSSSAANVYGPTLYGDLQFGVGGPGNIQYVQKTTDTVATAVPIVIGYHTASDEIIHHPPRNEQKMRTRYKWTTATGLYWAWADEIVSVSRAAFGFAGQSIPA